MSAGMGILLRCVRHMTRWRRPLIESRREVEFRQPRPTVYSGVSRIPLDFYGETLETVNEPEEPRKGKMTTEGCQCWKIASPLGYTFRVRLQSAFHAEPENGSAPQRQEVQPVELELEPRHNQTSRATIDGHHRAFAGHCSLRLFSRRCSAPYLARLQHAKSPSGFPARLFVA